MGELEIQAFGSLVFDVVYAFDSLTLGQPPPSLLTSLVPVDIMRLNPAAEHDSEASNCEKYRIYMVVYLYQLCSRSG